MSLIPGLAAYFYTYYSLPTADPSRTVTEENTLSPVNSFLASGDLLSADNLCIQFGPRSGATESKLFDTL